MQRYLALLLALIPISLAVLGIKLMRDTVFGILFPPLSILWLQFLIGALCSRTRVLYFWWLRLTPRP